MDLLELRKEIDGLDDQMLKLFTKRMEVCRQVAEYKKEKELPVLQGGREEEILSRIRETAPAGLEDGAAVLFSNLMDISKCLQQRELTSPTPMEWEPFCPENAKSVGCQGISGSYQEKACRKLFGDKPLTFFDTYDDVFRAVESGEMEYGVLPIQNSTAGSVAETYDLMRKYEFYIAARIQIKITHCLAARPGVRLEDVEQVYSYEQGLAQCTDFLRRNGLKTGNSPNTASAAKLCAESDRPIAAICSEDCAKQYGLAILCTDIANVSKNYTRFICFSKKFHLCENPRLISVSLSIPNVAGSLYRLLTKFSVNSLDLKHLESKPSQDGSFDTIFYLDFLGDVRDPQVSSLLTGLSGELSYYRFLGNYGEIL